MNPGTYIFDLLFEYDCVIIPGFGGFIGNYAPAKIQAAYHTFHPPYKSLLFNVNLKQNDGLLAFRISHEENISYSEALHSLETVVSAWNKELNAGNTVGIERVGKLFKDMEGNVQFEQDGGTNFLAESYGLTSFVSPVITRREAGRKSGNQVVSLPGAQDSSRRMIPKAVRWAAILALPVGTAAVMGISNFDKIRSLSVAYSGLLFSGNTTEPARNIRVAKPNVPVLRMVQKEMKPALPVKETIKPDTDAIRAGQSKPYSIIVGAFKFLDNADGLIADLKAKGYNASMTGQTRTGLYRVSINSFDNKEEAIRQLELVRSNEFSSAWLLVK